MRKQGEREREAVQLTRVKMLLGSEKMTQTATLEKGEQPVFQPSTFRHLVNEGRAADILATFFWDL